MKKLFAAGALLLTALFTLFQIPLQADDGNYQNYILGERTAGMGGAGAATSCDLDSAFYNPSGLGFVTASRLSLSASLYGIYNLKIRDGLGTNKNFRVREFESIPSTFGSILNLSEELTVAFSAFVPDNINYNHQEVYSRTVTPVPGQFQSEYFSFTVDDQQLWIGPSLGYRINRRLSLGLSLFAVYRSLVKKQAWTFLSTDEQNKIVSVTDRRYDVDYTNYSILGIFGTQYALSDRLRLALVVQTPSINLTGDGEFTYASGRENRVNHGDHLASRNKIPTKITIGAAFCKPKEYALEADLSYYLPTSFIELKGRDDWTGGEFCLRLRRRPVVNFNLGAEYYFIENYPARLGFFTNLSSSPDPDPEGPGSPEQIDMYGLTASVGNESEHTTINFGVNYVWGSGKTLGVDDDLNYRVVDARESYLFLFLSSTYIF
jgi:long-subunit fatty acid transport protein